jgi:hypothetical protein
MGEMQALRTLIRAPELHAGLVAGVAALVVGALVVAARRARGPRTARPGGIVGPAVVVATLAAFGGLGRFAEVGSVPARVVCALAGLWLAGEIGSRTARPVGAALALIAGVGLVDPSANSAIWIIAIVVLGPALAGSAVADFDRRASPSGLGPQLLLISIVGLYATVPDTELVLVLLGAMLPITLLAWPQVFARVGSGGAYAAIGLFLWISTIEGAGRPGSIVGAVATLALLVAEPVGRFVASRAHADRLLECPTVGRLRAGGFVVMQLLLAAYAARVAGRVDDPIVALVLALPGVAIGVAVGSRASLGPPRARTRPR